MGRRWRFWPLTGFLTAAVLGTLAHFTYRWSGGALLAGVFCAVNESVWEHMKLLFFPVFLFTAAQFCMGERDGLLAARAVSVTAGLALIPTLLYLHRRLGRARALGRRSYLLFVGGGHILAG